MSALSTELNEAIQKNLPTMVGEELKKVLKKAEADAAELADTKIALEGSREANATLGGRIAALQEHVAKLEGLGIRKEALDEQERNLKVTLAEASVLAERGKNEAVMAVVTSVFRNAEVRKTLHTSTPVPVTTNGFTGIQNHYTSETTETEIK